MLIQEFKHKHEDLKFGSRQDEEEDQEKEDLKFCKRVCKCLEVL